MTVERRSMQRFNLQLPISLQCKFQPEGQIKEEYVTTDICAAGAYCLSEYPLSVGTEINIELPWPPKDLIEDNSIERIFKLSGVVVRSDPEGMAIAFGSVFKFGDVT